MILYLLRHGQTEEQAVSPMEFPRDHSDLSATGRAELCRAANSLNRCNIDTILSSTRVRARQSACLLSNMLNLPVVYNEDLVEWRIPEDQLGTAAYLEFKQRRRRDPFFSMRGSESLSDFILRVQRVRSEIIAGFRGREVIAVTHYNPIKFWIASELAPSLTDPIEMYRLADTVNPCTGGLYRLAYCDANGMASAYIDCYDLDNFTKLANRLHIASTD